MALTGLTNIQPVHVHSIGISTFDGSVSVGGTLTYEDVTNVDSIGIVTARDDINIITDGKKLNIGASADLQLHHTSNHSYIDDAGAGNLRLRSGTLEIQNLASSKTSAIFSSGGGQTLNFNNSTKFVTTNTGVVITGICTATSFKGDGSNLTGITGTTINNNADNRLITGSGTANTLEGESSLTYNGLQLNISNDVPELFLTDTNSNNSYGRVRGNGGNLILSADVNNATGGSIINFEIDGSEKARITSDGKMGLNTNNPNPDAVGSNTVNTCLELGSPSGSDTASVIKFNGRDGGSNLNKCQIQWAGANNRFDITVNGNQALQIQPNKDVEVTDGNLIIGTAGHGIDFSATANYGTSTPAELLDDYEEGQFLPSYSPASGSITMLTRRGEYCKVGRVVHCMFSCSANGSSSPSGTVTITGLPFTGEVPSANGPRGGGGVVFAGYHAPTSLSHCNVNGNTLYLFLNDHSYLQANTSGTGFGYNAYQISGFFSYLTTA